MVYQGKESPTTHLLQSMINILFQHGPTRMHTAAHYNPILPSHAHTSPPLVNCIPLDDITGNKRQQQDNKRPQLQSTSFISDFITPPLMDVDLYTLLHLTCSIPQPPASLPLTPSVTRYLSVSLFSQCYL